MSVRGSGSLDQRRVLASTHTTAKADLRPMKTQHRPERAERVSERLSCFCCDSWTVETVGQTGSQRAKRGWTTSTQTNSDSLQQIAEGGNLLEV